MPSVTPDHVALIGASLAGLRTAEGLRRAGFAGRITLVGAEAHLPYSRPPLSKQILAGSWEPEKAQLRPPDRLHALDLDLRLGVRAEALDVERRVVVLSDGDLAFDALVLATGSSPRTLPCASPAGVWTLRTLDDAVAIRDAMSTRPRLVVVGAGFIGAEVAAVACRRGLEVTVIEPLEAPMIRGLGPELGAVAGRMHADEGVDLRCGVGVQGFEGQERVEAVVLTDGTTVPADLVLVGIGAVPDTDWLAGSGLKLCDGVVCDSTLAAEGVDGVWAAGDVARWFHPRYGEHVRYEHWTAAADHGHAVAGNIVAGPSGAQPHSPVPYVWSDQYDTKIQIIGRAGPDDDLHVVSGSLDDRRFVAVRSRDGTLTGAVGFGAPRPLMTMLARLQDGPLSVDEAGEMAGT